MRARISIFSARVLLAAAALVALPAAHSLAVDASGAYPVRPVRLVVSYAAGNVTDILARIITPRLGERWRQPIIVDNRPGQGGSIGAQVVSKAEADGYTLLFSAIAAMAVNPHIYASVGYSALNDFAPIVLVGYSAGGVIYVHPTVKANTLQELIALSKADPNALTYGSPGSGTMSHLNIEMFKLQTGMAATHVPHKGAAQVIGEVVAGRVQIGYDSSAIIPLVRAGKLRPLASIARQRRPDLPDVPTIQELVPGFEPVRAWLGIFAPAGLQPARVEQIYKDIMTVLRLPDVAEKLRTAGFEVIGMPPAEFRKLVAHDYDRLGKLVRAINLKAD
jgi:tripartite-type tricarboxylate transporter receptor subunit TctC